MIFVFLFILLFGCAKNYQVLGLYPHREQAAIKATTDKTINLLDVKSFESVRSVNVPILLKNGKMFTSSKFIWMRNPAVLLQEYFVMKWESMGGKISDDDKSNVVNIVLQNCYIDQISQKCFIDIGVTVNNEKRLVKQEGEAKDIVPAMLNAIDNVIDYVIRQAN